jgi:outer membrane protein
MHAPKFYAFGGYNFLENAPTDSHKSKQDQNWISGGIGLTLPLYEGGKIQAQSDKAYAQLSQARAQLEDLDSLIAMEVEKAYLAWQEQHETISIEQAALDLAEENFRSISDRYGQGIVFINDVLKAADQLAQSQLGINRAIYRAQSAYAHLSTTVGGKI